MSRISRMDRSAITCTSKLKICPSFVVIERSVVPSRWPIKPELSRTEHHEVHHGRVANGNHGLAARSGEVGSC